MLGTIILILLVLLLIGALPTWSHSSSWGYAPSGALGTVLVVVVLLVLGALALLALEDLLHGVLRSPPLRFPTVIGISSGRLRRARAPPPIR